MTDDLTPQGESAVRLAIGAAALKRDAAHWKALAGDHAKALRAVWDLEARWSAALDNGCPSCGPFVDDCDHIEGYHHALGDLWAAGFKPMAETEGVS